MEDHVKNLCNKELKIELYSGFQLFDIWPGSSKKIMQQGAQN